MICTLPGYLSDLSAVPLQMFKKNLIEFFVALSYYLYYFTVAVKVIRMTGAQDSRRILSDITVYDYDTTHLQKNPQRLG